jgi:hypothetical protein
MDEYSRILIEEYIMNHSSKKSRQLGRLLELSYSMATRPTDDDAIFLLKVIRSEKNPELKEALQELDEYLFS